MYCFYQSGSGGLKSEIKIKGQWGSQTTEVYQGYEAGNGETFDLQHQFHVYAQNVGDNFILRLRITDNNSGRIVFDDAAAKYGVISARN